MNPTPKTGRCQHCQQIRPLFKHEGELQFWGYDPSETAWLCARDHGRREIAIENDRPFHVDYSIRPFAETEAAS
jgi:hypothetical protein